MAYLFASYDFTVVYGFTKTYKEVCCKVKAPLLAVVLRGTLMCLSELFRVTSRSTNNDLSTQSLQRSNTVKTQDENGAKCRGGHTGTCHAQIKPVQYHNNQKVAVASLHMESRSRPLLPHTSMRRAPPDGSPGSTPPHQFQRSPMLRRAPLMHRPSRPHHGLGRTFPCLSVCLPACLSGS